MNLQTYTTKPETAAPAGTALVQFQQRKPILINAWAFVPMPGEFDLSTVHGRVLLKVYLMMVKSIGTGQFPLNGTIPETLSIPDSTTAVLREFIESSAVTFNVEELLDAIRASTTWGIVTPRFQQSIIELAPAIASRFVNGVLPVNDAFCKLLRQRIDERDRGEDWVEFVEARLTKHFTERADQEAKARELE